MKLMLIAQIEFAIVYHRVRPGLAIATCDSKGAFYPISTWVGFDQRHDSVFVSKIKMTVSGYDRKGSARFAAIWDTTVGPC